MKTYIVTVSAKFPASGEAPGEFEIIAKNSADAIKQARRKMSDAGHTKQDGALIYKAKLQD